MVLTGAPMAAVSNVAALECVGLISEQPEDQGRSQLPANINCLDLEGPYRPQQYFDGSNGFR